MQVEDYFHSNNLLSESNVRERVDEYSLLKHYTNIDGLGLMNSPFREDNKPSLSFFQHYNGSLLCKDFATGDILSIYDFIAKYLKIDKQSLLDKINNEYSLNLISRTGRLRSNESDMDHTSSADGATVHNLLDIRKPETNSLDNTKGEDKPTYYRKQKKESNIEIVSKRFEESDLNYWNSFHIQKATLQLFNVKCVKYVYYNGQLVGTRKPSNPIYSYEILGRYKIYKPLSTSFKWLNNYSSNYVEGLLQLQYKSDILIITKSLKDVMVLYELGYEAISPKSESTMIPEYILNILRTKYSNIYILFDNDMKHNGHKYDEAKIYVPIESKCKDISDYARMYGKENTVQLLNTILN